MRMISKRCSTMWKFFFSIEQGHSLTRSVKLLGRKQRIDFHHNQTTPYHKACGFSLLSSISVLHLQISIFIRSRFSIKVKIHQELWELCLCMFLRVDLKISTFMSKRFQAFFFKLDLFVTCPEPKII